MDMDNTEPRFYVKVRVFYGFYLFIFSELLFLQVVEKDILGYI